MRAFVILLFVFFSFEVLGQKAFTSVQDGDWNDASTWTSGGGAGGTEGIDYPSSSDIVVVDHYVIINAANSGSDFVFTGELTINEDDTLECQVGSATTGFILEGNGIMRNFGSFFTLDATEDPDENAHIPKEFICRGNSIFIGGLNSFGFIADDWALDGNTQVFLDNLLCYAVSDDVNFESTGCNMYGSGNVRIGGDGLNSTVNFNNGSTVAQLDDDITIWRNVASTACSGTSLSTGTSTATLPPFALDDDYTTLTNTAQNQFVLTEGVDDFSPVDDDTLTLISVGNNAAVNDGNTSLGGTVSINNNGTPSDPTDDYIVYTPPAATTGTDTYSYIINNKAGGADTALVTVIITASITDKDGDGIADATDVDDDNDGILDVDECGGATQTTTFTYTGADQTFNVPAAAVNLTAKVWGAGGRGDTQSGRGTGGAGGYAEISIPVSSLTSSTLIITVGEGGNSSTGSVTYGNGGAGLSGGGRNYGAGGGMSAVSYITLATPGSVVDADLLAIAGGGGTVAAFTNAGSQAGEGGGTNGGNGSTTDSGGEGGGGTQSAGGSSTSGNAGAYLLGGDAVTDGGAGGGGYYGGGSGFPNSGNEGLGGGGSGYVTPSATSSTLTAGSGQTPPNTGDADYVAGVGDGGDNNGDNGGNGLVIITVTIGDCDSDNDGVINSCDLDSDNDGIPDIVEAGGEDTNGDGLVDVTTDADGDGWSNLFDSDNGGTALANPDTDGDGYINTGDIDADGDGIVDIIESQASGTLTSPTGTDSDGDGIDDAFDPDNGNSLTTPVNTDGTDNPDYTDTDADNDGVSDDIEGYDTDNDGVANTLPSGTDTDGDGLDDNYDNMVGPNSSTNVTNNGQSSSSFPNLDNNVTAELDWREKEDKDNDGIVDIADRDDDNDGVLDEDECGIPIASTTFTFTGADQTYNVPVNATILRAKIWGAGGRGDERPGRGTGGAGGFTEFFVQTSDLTSSTIIVTVGEGGNSSTGAVTYGNGGAGLSGGGRNYGAGGGMSAISYVSLATPGSVSLSDLLAIAGGGGSAAAFTNPGSQAGEGGGTTGGDGVDSDPTTGGGGTQSAGGSSTSGNPGAFLLGGNAVSDGGAGGGGYYGGGSGFLSGSDEGLGGGGSGYISNVGAGTTTAGSGQTPPNTTDADYVAGVGDGGDNNNDNGGNGLVIIEAFFTDCDTDGDGILNGCDLDADGDGIADIVEAGGLDTDGDGIVDVTTDTDGDGWADTFDPDNGGTVLVDEDTDSDGAENRLDIDSDDDGIVDIIESQATGTLISPSGTDTDGDGVDDNFDTDSGNSLTDPVNTDGTDNPDYADVNSDNDSQPDIVEGWDTDNDGVPDTSPSGTDTDGDGLDDNFDNIVGPNGTTNVTNNGQSSSTFPNLDLAGTSERDWREIIDTDGDGLPDEFDIDDDNDGILDTEERQCSSGYADAVTSNVGATSPANAQGVADEASAILPLNAVLVMDLTDLVPAGHYVRLRMDRNNSNRVLVEGSADNAVYTEPVTYGNTSADVDMAVVDVQEYFLHPIGSGGARYIRFTREAGSTDLDAIAYTAQCAVQDTDGDGVEDHLDLDSDNDGIADIIEAGGVDTDNDGRVDSNTDTDEDGWADTFDASNGGTALTDADTDGDGFENRIDLDSDSDGITDNVEGQTTAAFLAPLGTDTDGDGWDDRYDSDNGGTAISLSNNESAGNPDYTDDDSDGDGTGDFIEGFDDNGNGDALDDLVARANTFETAAGNPLYYVNADDTDMDGIPNWLEDDDMDNVVNFLDPSSAFYQDTDGDGLVDLYDSDNFGLASNLPDFDGDGEYDFRDTDETVGGLPIDLVRFTAQKEQQRTLLQWTTATEINNDYFTIERSANAVDFQPILRLKGAGNSQETKNYSIYDEQPLLGYNYYRLRQTDFDGQTKHFWVEVVYFDAGEEKSVLIYPNPHRGDQLKLRLNGFAHGNYRLLIYDIHGKQCKSYTLQMGQGEDITELVVEGMDELKSGVYILNLIGENYNQSFRLLRK